jgi:hypothetical protein
MKRHPTSGTERYPKGRGTSPAGRGYCLLAVLRSQTQIGRSALGSRRRSNTGRPLRTTYLTSGGDRRRSIDAGEGDSRTRSQIAGGDPDRSARLDRALSAHATSPRPTTRRLGARGHRRVVTRCADVLNCLDGRVVRRLEWWSEHVGGPLWDSATSVSPEELGLAPDLIERLARWNASYGDNRLPIDGPGDPAWLEEGADVLREVRGRARRAGRGRLHGALVGRAR